MGPDESKTRVRACEKPFARVFSAQKVFRTHTRTLLPDARSSEQFSISNGKAGGELLRALLN